MTEPALQLESGAEPETVYLMTISQAVDLWLGELVRVSRSERTIATYRRLLDELCDHYPHARVHEVTTEMCRRFLDDQAKRKRGRGRKSPATIAQNVSIVAGFFKWLTAEGVIKRNPCERNGMPIIGRPKLTKPEENDNVTTVSTADVLRILEAANTSGRWNRRLAVNVALFLGPRRHAIAQARRGDYDPDDRMLTFREKGGKTIRKPVPDQLARLLDAAIASGVYESDDDYLIPGDAQQRRPGDRDDRVIWRLVRDVAADAGVDCHVHALRAAFAVAFLEQKPGGIMALRDLLGHSRLETTLIYLRRLDRRQAMETVRDFSYGPQFAGNPLEAKPVAEKEGFEPSFHAEADGSGAGTHNAEGVPLDEALLGLIPRETGAHAVDKEPQA